MILNQFIMYEMCYIIRCYIKYYYYYITKWYLKAKWLPCQAKRSFTSILKKPGYKKNCTTKT